MRLIIVIGKRMWPIYGWKTRIGKNMVGRMVRYIYENCAKKKDSYM